MPSLMRQPNHASENRVLNPVFFDAVELLIHISNCQD